AGVDLDLHVTTPDGACGFSTPEGLAEVAFQEDDRGSGPGIHGETMTIRPKGISRFDIIVHAYSGASSVGEGDPRIELRWEGEAPGYPERQWSLRHADAGCWHVAAVVPGEGRPLLVDRPAQDFTPGKGWRPRLEEGFV